jgi:hypothetical protein
MKMKKNDKISNICKEQRGIMGKNNEPGKRLHVFIGGKLLEKLEQAVADSRQSGVVLTYNVIMQQALSDYLNKKESDDIL